MIVAKGQKKYEKVVICTRDHKRTSQSQSKIMKDDKQVGGEIASQA